MMALKDLSPQQMLNLSGAWLDPQRERPRIERLSRVSPLLPDLQAAHDGVRTVHQKDTALSDELKAVQEAQMTEDKVHDRKARGSYSVLTGFADLADDPAEAAVYLQVRDQLFTGGLRFITGSYADEAGEAQLARARLTPASRGTLEATAVPGGNLLQAVLAWFAAADALGVLEHRRAKLESEIAGQKATGLAGSQVRSRNRWIRVMRTMLQNAELEDLDEDTERHLLAPLQRALDKAERRAPAAKGSEPEDEAPVCLPGAEPTKA